MKYKTLYWLFFFTLCGLECSGQQTVLTMPFKYFRPTQSTDLVKDQRKSIVRWEVFADREGIVVFEDSLKKIKSAKNISFLNAFWVLKEGREMIELVKDTHIDSVTLSNNAEVIGWVDKKNMILWNRFLSDEKGTKLLATSNLDFTKNESTVEPNSFDAGPKQPSPYYLYYITKFDHEGNVLIGSLSFNSQSPGNFCWVKQKDITILNSRNGLIPRREAINSSLEPPPTIYNPINEQELENYKRISPETGFINRKSLIGDFDQYQSMTNNEVLIRKDTNSKFDAAILMNSDEWRNVSSAIEILSQSENKQDMERKWQKLFAEGQLTLNKSKSLIELFGELIHIHILDKEEKKGSPLAELPFIRTADYQKMLTDLKRSNKAIHNINVSVPPYSFTPYNFPHYWIPLKALPLEALTMDFEYYKNRQTLTEVEKWKPDNQVKSYESFDLFYVINNQADLTYEIKDAFIKKFYRASFNLKANENQSSLIYYSNLDHPEVGQGVETTDLISQRMRESDAPDPNTYFDKKLLRAHLYKRNIKKIKTLRFHVFCGMDYLSNPSLASRRILESFVKEYRKEVKPDHFEVLLYVANGEKDILESIVENLNKKSNKRVIYQIKSISP